MPAHHDVQKTAALACFGSGCTSQSCNGYFQARIQKKCFLEHSQIIHSPADQHGCVSDGTITNAVVLIIVAAIVVVPA